jgi:hypothetical protein
VNAQQAASLAATNAAELSEERARALGYYLGNMDEDMPSQEGRSRAVSTDVSDVEGLLTQLMEIFVAFDEVLVFEPVGPEDEDAAAQETSYANHVFMQRDAGFMDLYSFIKDAIPMLDWSRSIEKERGEEQRDRWQLLQPRLVSLACAVDFRRK